MEFQDLLNTGSPQKPLLWLDGHAYAARLFANDQPPWLQATECIAWLRKSNGLLKPAVPVLPVATVMQAYLEHHADLRAAMAAKSRLVYPAKTLLADEGLQGLVSELAAGLVSTAMEQPVALSVSSPLHMAQMSYQWAHGETAEFGEDEADSCAAYLADFLRSLAQSNISVLLLEEAPGLTEHSAQLLNSYQAVCNVAQHYRWALGLDLGAQACWQGDWPDALDFILAMQSVDGGPSGLWLTDTVWGEPQVLPAEAPFLALRIPADANPEMVLDLLETLRARGE